MTNNLGGTATSAPQRKATGKRALTAALLAGVLALGALGFASGTAQAQRPRCETVCDGSGCYQIC